MEELTLLSRNMRKQIFKIAYKAGGGHIASAFSVIDILVTLYFGNVMSYDSKNPEMNDRDKLILSKGHSSYALYAVLCEAGFFDKHLLDNVGKPGSSMGGHPKLGEIPGVEASTGALGHGLSFGIGTAFADKVDGLKSHVYVVLGDGECQEGSIWEGALSAPTLGLDNLTVIIDYNKLQAMDKLEKIVKMEPFGDKWRAFGWNVLEVNGHDHASLKEALLTRVKDKPTLVIANTIKGKGVSFMEQNPIWHYRMPNEEELKILLNELEMSEKELMS